MFAGQFLDENIYFSYNHYKINNIYCFMLDMQLKNIVYTSCLCFPITVIMHIPFQYFYSVAVNNWLSWLTSIICVCIMEVHCVCDLFIPILCNIGPYIYKWDDVVDMPIWFLSFWEHRGTFLLKEVVTQNPEHSVRWLIKHFDRESNRDFGVLWTAYGVRVRFPVKAKVFHRYWLSHSLWFEFKFDSHTFSLNFHLMQTWTTNIFLKGRVNL